MDIQNLSLTHVMRNIIDVKNYRGMLSRIQTYKYQIQQHYNEKNYYPIAGEVEIKRIERNAQYYKESFLLINNIKIKTIKKELNKHKTAQQQWEENTKLEWILPAVKINHLTRHFLDKLENKSVEARKYQLQWRLNIELEIAHHNQYYTIFNTLTVAPEHYTTVFNKNNKIFQKYINNIDKIIGKNNHTYIAVVEHGGKTGRLHIHTIHILKNIPQKWKIDPNLGSSKPINRIIPSCRTLWKYGFSTPIALRINAQDAWAQIGWLWPHEKVGKSYQPIIIGSTGQIANYMAKYIVKALQHKGEYTWKTRMRQQFGMTIINQTINQLTMSQLEQMLKIQHSQVFMIHGKAISPQLLTIATHRNILQQFKKSKNSTQLMTLEARPSIMKQFRNLTMLPQTFNQANSIPSEIQNTINTDIFNIQCIFDKITRKETGFVIPGASHIALMGTSKHT